VLLPDLVARVVVLRLSNVLYPVENAVALAALELERGVLERVLGISAAEREARSVGARETS
jgi:hypothetical protein